MNRMLLGGLTLSVLAAANAMLGGASATAADASPHVQRNLVPRTGTPSCTATFNVVGGANPGAAADVILENAIAAVNDNDIWAVGGQRAASGQPDQTLAEHWDGSTWSAINTPNSTVGSNDFRGAAAIATNNVWAVGDFPEGSGVGHPYAAQWTTTWTGFNNLPSVGTGNNRLSAVAAVSATNIWAVGSSRADTVSTTPRRTLIEQYNGTTWSVVASPDVSSTSDDQLLGVAATSATDVWAVGISTHAGVGSNLIKHWNGTAWSTVISPSPTATANALYGVAGLSGTNAYAVGDYQDSAGRLHTSVLHWDGAFWTAVASPTVGAGTFDDILFSVSATSPTNIWAAGAVYSPTSNGAPSDTLVEHWDGTSWTVVPSQDGASGQFNELHAIIATSAANVWAAGDYVNSGLTQDLTLFENLCIDVAAIFRTTPNIGNTTGETSVIIIGRYFNFATGVSFGTTPATSFVINSNFTITAIAPAMPVGAVGISITNYAGSSNPFSDQENVFAYTQPAVSWQQYRLDGSDGTTWTDIDASTLVQTITPTVASNAVLNANADLWTASPGVNQDLGIFISGGAFGAGQVMAWKESGGGAGTFSPNAAAVQTVASLAAGITYTVKLQWKANHPTPGSIFVGAGLPPPMPKTLLVTYPTAFSPTRLTVELIPATNADLLSAVSTKQYTLAGSDGSTWKDMDGSTLAITNYTPTASGSALLSANADLWTQNTGINQDLGIFVSGGALGAGQIVAGKESRGNAGTFSPNAAYAQAVVQLVAATPYTIKLRWKANHATTGTIRAAAGLGPQFSPTRLAVRLFPSGTGLQDVSSTQQYNRVGDIFATERMPIDGNTLTFNLTPTATSLYILSGNADLWTANAGVNQDLGIIISGGEFGTGIVVAWKESGGFSGTFSPNAAFVQAVIPLTASKVYTVWLGWKVNHATTGTIYAGAGLGPAFSPTRLTVQTTS